MFVKVVEKVPVPKYDIVDTEPLVTIKGFGLYIIPLSAITSPAFTETLYEKSILFLSLPVADIIFTITIF